MNQIPTRKKRTVSTGRPIQRLHWKEKIANDYEWFKQNADYYISGTNFHAADNKGIRDIGMLYKVYNNQFPLQWFDHITNPLNATNELHKKYPAKIRPTGMLRTNIDLLLGEFPKRPFSYFVQNMGEDAYNSYLEGLSSAIESNLQEHFLAVAQPAMQDQGMPVGQIPQEQDIELPDSVATRFTSNYKDNLAIRAQKWMKRAVTEYKIRQKLLKMFKDWLIAGETYSYKNIVHGNLVYERVSPMEIRFDKSEEKEMVEDGEWVVRRRLLTLSDVVDEYYDELTEQMHQALEQTRLWASPESMYNYLGTLSGDSPLAGHIPVYHLEFKGRKQIKHIIYTDPLTGVPQEMTVDEDTPINEDMKVEKTEWINEVYEVTRIGQDMYCRMRPIPVQRNAMNNFSVCKLSYNGRRYSDTHAQNTSVLEMGLPYAIMYMITNYTLEKTIAKNKGKIALIDKNAIPRRDGWDDEKFFYYADAQGYMLVDRNQMGVDKSWNQYHVLDMSLWDQIKNLIELRDSFIRDWDRLLGINDQRKAQIGSSDGLGTTQTALFQSSVITDMIYTLFEEFIETEMQGFLDFSRFVNVEGIRGLYNQDDFDRELLEIDPNSYCNAELGLFMVHSSTEMQTLMQYKQQVQAMIQNGVKQSTILEIQRANNVEELLGKLRRLEELEMEQAMAGEEIAHEKAMELETIKENYERLRSLLRIDEINAEWDRRDENEMIRGEYNLFGFGGDGDNNDNGIPDAVEIGRRITTQQQLLSKERMESRKLAQAEREHRDAMAQAEKDRALEREKLKSKERTERIKAKSAARKAKAKS